MNYRRNFKTVLILLLVSGGILVLLGLFTEGQMKRMSFGLSAGMGLAALVQCILFAVSPKLFKDKHRPY